MFGGGRCGSGVNDSWDFTSFSIFYFFQLVTIHQKWEPIEELEMVKKLRK